MKAAIVTHLDQAPIYGDFPAPKPAPKQVLITVLASSVNQRVRSQADGSHYTQTPELPFIPGLDGVGRTSDGQLVYFLTRDPKFGALAEQTVTQQQLMFPLPEDADPAQIAASVNPAMAGWMALRVKAGQVVGKRVLVLGATGAAGTAAVQIAKTMGAAHAAGVGRNRDKLAALSDLGADTTVQLGDTAALAALPPADIVLDFLWGAPSATVMMTLLKARRDHAAKLIWIEIGGAAGPTLSLPAAALRSTGLTLVGSGQGSLTLADYQRELPALFTALAAGKFVTPTTVLPLSQVHDHWQDRGAARLVFQP